MPLGVVRPSKKFSAVRGEHSKMLPDALRHADHRQHDRAWPGIGVHPSFLRQLKCQGLSGLPATICRAGPRRRSTGNRRVTVQGRSPVTIRSVMRAFTAHESPALFQSWEL